MPVIIYKTPSKAETKAAISRRAKEFVPTKWGCLFRQMREESDLSQRELAVVAGVNRNALRKLEQDPSGSSFEIIEKIAQVLGYEIDIMSVQKSPYAPA